MAWTSSAYPCLKPWVQQLTKNGKKENYKHLSLLIRGCKGVVSAAVEQSRRKANKVDQGDGKFGP